MGQSQSNLEQSRMSVPKINSLLLLKQVNDIRYGDIKIYKLQDNHTIAVQDHVFHDDQQWLQFKQQAELNFKNQEPFLIQMIDLQHVTEKELCTQMTQAHSVYEYFEEYLEKVISEQSSSKQQFEEIEIVAMIHCTLKAIQKLSEQQKYHGDIRPLTISVTSYTKRSPNRRNEPYAVYKLTDIQELTDMNAFRRCVTKQQGSYNLSPEQLQFLKQKVLKPSYDLNKSDVFSIGITALQMATLNSLYDIYDLQNYIINTDKLDNYIREMKTQYSEQLSTLICQLLSLAPENRPNSQTANEHLIGYRFQLEDYFRQSTIANIIPNYSIDFRGVISKQQNQINEQILISKVVDTTELFEQMEIIEQRAKVALQRSQDAQIKYQKSPGKQTQKQSNWEPTKSCYLYNNLTPITQKELNLSNSKQDIPLKQSSVYSQNAPKYQQQEVAEYEYDHQDVDEKQLKQNYIEPIEIITSNPKQIRQTNNTASFSQQQLFESVNTDQQKLYNNNIEQRLSNYNQNNNYNQYEQQLQQQQLQQQSRTYNQQSYYQRQSQELEPRLSQQLRDKDITKQLTGYDKSPQQQQSIYPQMEYQQPIEAFDPQRTRQLNRQLTGSIASRQSNQQL